MLNFLLDTVRSIKHNTLLFFRNTNRSIKNKFTEKYYTGVLGLFSQYGEDLILDRLLMCKDTGFYVDIGANDPNKFSNTLRFYKRGWNGINIEPNVHKYKKISMFRERDVNLNMGVGPSNCLIPFYLIAPDTLSTFDKKIADIAVTEGFKLENVLEVPVIRLDDLMKTYCKDKVIDFMSVDVEGYEISVLTSNNWNIFRPKFILIEINRAEEEIQRLLIEVGYLDIFDNRTNKIYIDIRSSNHNHLIFPLQ